MIHTINTRNNIIWQAINGYYELSANQFTKEIKNSYNDLLDILIENGIEYEKLKYALVPNADVNKKEVILVLNQYNNNIYMDILSILNKNTIHNILGGDYIYDNVHQNIALDLFYKNIKIVNFNNMVDLYHIYYIYINNLTISEFDKLISQISLYPLFIGYQDFTNSNDLKDYIA